MLAINYGGVIYPQISRHCQTKKVAAEGSILTSSLSRRSEKRTWSYGKLIEHSKENVV
jgi:hypothetical protein